MASPEFHFDRPRDEAAGVGDLHEVGEVIFLLGVVRGHRVQHGERTGAGKGHRTGVAQALGALGLGRVLVLPDRREPPVPLDEPAVAGRIGGREAERDEVRAVREAGPQRCERRAANQGNVGVSDDDVVVAARRSPPARPEPHRPCPAARAGRRPRRPARPGGPPRPHPRGRGRPPPRCRLRRPRRAAASA